MSFTYAASSTGVYPRVGGGNTILPSSPTRNEGLSPRGRGKRVSCRRCNSSEGSIPAWAGETVGSSVSSMRITVYPRVGGGNACLCPLFTCSRGLSPRGRGKHERGEIFGTFEWSIPAWAGETASAVSRRCPAAVYPRVGGGNQNLRSASDCDIGLSPRGRGKQVELQAANRCVRSIPAWAGETASG